MPVTDGFKTIASFFYEEYDDFDAPRESIPWKYGGGWWVTIHYDTVSIPEHGTPGDEDYFPGGNYARARLARSRQPFTPYEVLESTPIFDQYGVFAASLGAPGAFDWFKFETGYWWVMVRDTIPVPEESYSRFGARLWYSDDLNTWHLAPIPEPSTATPCDYWYEHNIEYHAASGRYWATMIVTSGEPDGYEIGVPGPFADDPTNYKRGCVVSATSPSGPWTITYPGFGETTNELSTTYGERHASNTAHWERGDFDLLAEDYASFDLGDRGKRSGQNDGKCFKIELVTEFVYPELPWILYGNNYYYNYNYYYCYVLPYHLEKRFRTEYVMWHADDPTGPWTRTVLRAYSIEYNWVNMGCGSWSGTSTTTLDNNALPGPWQIANPPWYSVPYYTDYSTQITAWGDGDWLVQGPSEGEGQYANYYLENRRFYKASGYPMDGPWTEYALPDTTTDLGWADYRDGYWVLLCKDTDAWTVKTWVGTSLSSLEVAPFFGTPPNLYANAFPMWYAGDGQWLIYCAWNLEYYLAYPWWRPFSPGGAGWGTELR